MTSQRFSATARMLPVPKGRMKSCSTALVYKGMHADLSSGSSLLPNARIVSWTSIGPLSREAQRRQARLTPTDRNPEFLHLPSASSERVARIPPPKRSDGAPQ